MPTLNPLLEQRYSRALRVQLGLQESLGIDAVSPELQPVVVTESDRPELAVWKGERLCCGGLVEAAGASRSQICLFNPAGSGVLITLEKILFSSAGTDFLELWWFLAAGIVGFTTSALRLYRDSRLRSTQTPSTPGTPTGLLLSSAAAPPSGFQITGGIRVVALASPQQLEMPFAITPGFGIALAHLTVAQNLEATFFWRERGARADELGFAG